MKIILSAVIFTAIFIGLAGFMTAQVNVPKTNEFASAFVKSRFLQPEIPFKSGEMISNVIGVANTNGQPITFTIDLSFPSDWKSLHNSLKVYTVNPGDSIFIPVRILPNYFMKGNTRYLFNAFIISTDGKQLSYCYFFASTKKITSWTLDAFPSAKLYFKNKETSASFSTSIMNTGNEDQEILLTLQSMNRNVIITDTADKIIEKPVYNLSLASQQDTTFHFKTVYFKQDRNYKRIDFDSYYPYTENDETRYTIYINSVEAKHTSSSLYSEGKKIEFVQLPNIRKVNQYGSRVIPLIADANIYNILGDYPMMNLNLRGNMFFRNNSSLFYTTQLSFTTNYLSSKAFENVPFYISYVHPKFNVQFGDISGTVLGLNSYGKGIRGEYIINDKHRVGAFVTKQFGWFNPTDVLSFGIHHLFTAKKSFSLMSQLGHTYDWARKINTDVLDLRSNFQIAKKHHFSVSIAGGNNFHYETDSNKYNKQGFSAGLHYSSKFFKNKLSSGIGGRYTSPEFGTYNRERITATAANSYILNKKWTISLNDLYYRYESSYRPDTVVYTVFNTQFNNQLNFNRLNSSIGNFMPFVFYNVAEIDSFISHSRGAGVNVGNYNLEHYTRYFTNLRMGYTHALKQDDKEEYFFLQFATMLQYRTFSFMARYTYGTPTLSRMMFNSLTKGKYPQSVSLSVQHQYAFRNPGFVVQYYGGYSYSTLSGNSCYFNPEFDYFSRSGWRFRVMANFNLSVNNADVEFTNLYYSSSQTEGDRKPSVSKTFTLSVGVRKEFGIPIPSKKVFFSTNDFVTFLDINGNHLFDKNEPLLENVVIRVGTWEIISDSKGAATFKNVPVGTYPYMVFSLTDLEGWFPNKSDSITLSKSGTIFIPFTRGVKIYGDIILDREKYATDAGKQLDLSRIKIAATDDVYYMTLTDYKGRFSFYVPYGKYTLTMDEAVLGDRFKLVQNNYELIIDEKMDNLYIPFYVVEKKRNITTKKFSTDGTIINNNPVTNPVNNVPVNPVPVETNTPVNSDTTKTPVNNDNVEINPNDPDLIPISAIPDKGLVYLIQLFEDETSRKRYDEIPGQENISGLVCVAGYKGNFLYMTQSFTKFKKAEKFLEEVRALGYNEAKIIAYRDGVLISLEEAGVQ